MCIKDQVLSVFLTGQRLIDERSGSRKLSDDLIVIFIDVQPTPTLKRIFLHRQGLEQCDLQEVTTSCVIIHVVIFISGSWSNFQTNEDCSSDINMHFLNNWQSTVRKYWEKVWFFFCETSCLIYTQSLFSIYEIRCRIKLKGGIIQQTERVMGLTLAKCQPENGCLFSCQMRSFSSLPMSGISTYSDPKKCKITTDTCRT